MIESTRDDGEKIAWNKDCLNERELERGGNDGKTRDTSIKENEKWNGSREDMEQ